jgi:hypothetical protein
MKRLTCAALIAGFSLQAHAIGNLADVTITDRDSGAAIPTHYYKGEYWIAGRPGARYAINIRNQRGERLMAVTAVDGVNVITGQTGNYDQTGYVFNRWQGYEITGWRKSNAEVAAFEFTSLPDSYAARTGRTKNIGVIGVALFRERPPIAIRYERPAAEAELAADSAPSPVAGNASGIVTDKAERSADSMQRQKLGTGHGQRENSYVENTEFEREQSFPNEIIRIRYDSAANLLAMGVIRRSIPRQVIPEPFPESPLARYVPDPPAYR